MLSDTVRFSFLIRIKTFDMYQISGIMRSENFMKNSTIDSKSQLLFTLTMI